MNTQRAAKPQNPASRYQLGRSCATAGLYSRYVMFILTSVTEVLRPVGFVSTYSNIGLYTLLQNTEVGFFFFCGAAAQRGPWPPHS